MQGTSFEDKLPQVLLGGGGWGRRGWMDRRGEIEEERRRGRGGRGVIQEESCTVRADQSQEFCLWANLLF